MKKHKFHYAVSGYRWAPESFRASKGLAGRPKMNIPLTYEERCEVGHLCLEKGFEAAVGYVKHVERARERQRQRMITYGFRFKEAPGRFAYCPQLYFRSDAPIDERLRVFKTIRSVLAETDGRVVTSTECELDGRYNPVNVREHTETVNFSRPLRIPMGEEIIRDPPRPHSKAPKKVWTKKHRNAAPGR